MIFVCFSELFSQTFLYLIGMSELPSVSYVFGTVTLDNWFHSMTIVKQLHYTHEHVIHMLNCMNSKWELCYELTKKGVIHYHFKIESNNVDSDIIVLIDSFKTCRRLIDKKYHNLFGFTKIELVRDTNEDRQRVSDYLMKDINKTRQCIQRVTKRVDFFDKYPVWMNNEMKRTAKAKKDKINYTISLIDDINKEFDEII